MAILYPSQIVNVYIQGIEFTGNIVSVGNDGNYIYDYSNPSAAFAAAPTNTLILIYPGTYTMTTDNDIKKNFFVRGMGEATTDVVINNESSKYETIITGGYSTMTYLIFENFKCQTNHSSGATFVIWRGVTSTNVYFNKMEIKGNASGAFCVDFYNLNYPGLEYKGDCFITYSRLPVDTSTYQYRGLGFGNPSATYSFTNLEYNKAYGCNNCSYAPDPHSYSVGAGTNFGYGYGDYLILFNVPPPPSAVPGTPLYRNVWAHGNYVYHTTLTGIDVYNDDASSIVNHIALPNAATAVWANDDYVYMGTLTSGVYRSTASGTAMPFIKEPYTTSNNTMYLHGSDDFLCLTTLAGVDRYDLSTASGTTMSGVSRIYTYDQYIHKCFQGADGTFYYLENNLFFNVDESPAGLGRPLREWTYYQLLPFFATSIDNSQVRVQFVFDFPYQNTKDAGEDLRFIDAQGNNLSYYIEEWYPNASVLVKIPAAGTDHVYMLYGNAFAQPQSDIANTYYFYDDFSILDSNVWTVYKGSSSNYAVITNGYLNMYDYNNSGTAVVTNSKLPYSLYIKARIRRQGGTNTSQFDGVHGYVDAPTKNRPNRGYIRLDIVTGPDDTLHYLHAYDTAVQGVKSMSTTWYVWESLWAPGYQKSTYREETLERTSTSTVFDTSNYFMFHIDNSSYHPNLNVDWVSMETWPENIALTTTEQLFWELIHPKLHAVYTPDSNWPVADHIYEEFYGDPLLLNDIHVTEGTSSHNNDNVILLATNRGAHIIEERQGDEENANQKRYYII